MAVVLEAKDVDEFLSYAVEERTSKQFLLLLVTERARMVVQWNGTNIVDLSREFLSSNGAAKHQDVQVRAAELVTSPWSDVADLASTNLQEALTTVVSDVNVASNKGLSERFDSTIGAATVLMPFGGAQQLTPSSAMVAKFPVDGETTTASAMAWGFNPFIMEKNQFTGAYLSVVESVAKLIAAGFSREKAYLSFKEYFEKLRTEPASLG